ncbi:MAG TPA: hypothetical protein VHG72_14095 [Polyangia bacterium]|nr:hypothetical protein [Polyangia bacterium]
MKLALTLTLLCSLSGVARAETIGYVDTTRVNATATEPVRLLGELQRDQRTKNGENQAAIAAFQRGNPAEQEGLRQKAIALMKLNADDLKKEADETDAKLRKPLVDVLARLRSAHHLTQVSAGPGMVLSPGIDLTDEAIKLLDAGDVVALKAKADDRDAQKARADALEKQLAEARKVPVAAVPAAPPAAPPKVAKR